MQVVDRFVDHGEPLSFRELCARVLEEEHDYLVLDLDKTTHLGRNLGELLAWELCAYEAYGESETDLPVRRWFGARVLVDWSKPTHLVRYLGSGLRRWALPGVHYLVWGKLASRIPWLRRLSYRRFGPHPTSAVQRRPQMVALMHLATADESLLLKLARRVWKRHAPDQVIFREDLDWIRARVLVDINSPTPFPPIVPRASPIRAVHSAIVLTDEEQRRRSNGNTGYLDPRRRDRGPTQKVDLDREGLRTRIGDLLDEINRPTARKPSLPQPWEAAHALNELMGASRATLTTAIKIG